MSKTLADELERLDKTFFVWTRPGEEQPDLFRVRSEMHGLLWDNVPLIVAALRAYDARRNTE